MNGIPIVGELLYTSAPRGIRHSGQGFTTVQVTSQLDPRLADALESLSAYHAVNQDNQSSTINYMHLRMNAPYFRGHVLSRIGPGDRELSLRSNKFAHHIAIPRHPLPTCSPLTLATSPAFQSQWDQRVCELPLRTLPPPSQRQLTPCPARTWETLLGDAGWAGQILEWALSHTESTWIVFDDPHPIQRLMQELLAILPSRDTWQVTFATHFANLPTSVDCRLRWIHARSPEYAKLKQRSAPYCINLVTRQCSQPLSQSSLWVQAARLGQVHSISQDPPLQLQTSPRKRETLRQDPINAPSLSHSLPNAPPLPLDRPTLDLPSHAFSPLPASRPFPLWIILLTSLAGSLLLGILAASIWLSPTTLSQGDLNPPSPNPTTTLSPTESDSSTHPTPQDEPPTPHPHPADATTIPTASSSPITAPSTTPNSAVDAPSTNQPTPPSPILTQLQVELPKLQLAMSLGPQKLADFPTQPPDTLPFDFRIDGNGGLPEVESFDVTQPTPNQWFIFHRNLSNEEHQVAEVLLADQQLQFQWNSWAESDLARSQRLGHTRWTFENPRSIITLQLSPNLIDGQPLKCRDIATQSTFLPLALEPGPWKIYFDALHYPHPVSIDAFKPLNPNPISWDPKQVLNPTFFIPFQDDSDPPFDVGLRIQPELLQQERGLSIKWKGTWSLGAPSIPPEQWPAWSKPGLDSLFKSRVQRLGFQPSNSISKDLDNAPAPLKNWYQDFTKKYLAQNNLFIRIRVVEGEYLLGRTP